MNTKPHTHDLEFFHRGDWRWRSCENSNPDPDLAERVRYGDQTRDWPQRAALLPKSRRKRNALSPSELQAIDLQLHQQREACLREIVAAHDKASVEAGRMERDRTMRLHPFRDIVSQEAMSNWNR